MRILVVDDHAAFRAQARALLEADGFTVVGEAEDGESAVTRCGELRPDLVLLDIGLPDVDGISVAERIVASGDGPRPAVLLTSAREASVYGSRLRGSAAIAFIPKDQVSGPAIRAALGRSGSE